jgi:hypothetical protein
MATVGPMLNGIGGEAAKIALEEFLKRNLGQTCDPNEDWEKKIVDLLTAAIGEPIDPVELNGIKTVARLAAGWLKENCTGKKGACTPFTGKQTDPWGGETSCSLMLCKNTDKNGRTCFSLSGFCRTTCKKNRWCDCPCGEDFTSQYSNISWCVDPNRPLTGNCSDFQQGNATPNY